MHKKALLLAFLCLCFSVQFARGQALKNPNYVGGVQEAGRPVYPYTHAWFVSLNDSIQYPCGFNGTPTEQWGYTFFALATGGDVDATCYQQPFNITADIFSPVSKPILIYLPDVAITVTANVTVPSNFMFCYGPGSSFTAGVGYTLVNNAQPCNGSGGGKGQPVNWYANHTLIGTEPGGDFDNGSGVSITGLDDATNKQVHITVNASGQGCPTGTGGNVPDSTLCAGPASGGSLSPAIVQSNDAVYTEGSSFTQTLAFNLPVKAGDQLIVAVVCGSNQSGLECPDMYAPTVTDTQLNSYSQVDPASPTFGVGRFATQFAIATAASSGADTLTIIKSGGIRPYDAIAIFEAANVGTFEGYAQDTTGCGYETISCTATYTTLNGGDFLLGFGAIQANNTATSIYQNSADWLSLDPGKEIFNSPYYALFAWSASQSGAAGTRNLTYSGYPYGVGIFSESDAAIFAWQPATYPPPGSGPPTFRYQMPPDEPSLISVLKLRVTPQTFYGLPACGASTEGFIQSVEDANVSTPGATISTGGSTEHVEGYCDGTQWVVAAVSTGPVGRIAPITFDNDTQSVTALTSAQLTGHTQMGYVASVYEIDVFADTGATSVNIAKVHAGTPTALMSGQLASGSGGAIACASLNAKCVDGATSSSGSVSIVTTGSANVLAAGDIIEISAATADGTATRFTAMVYLR